MALLYKQLTKQVGRNKVFVLLLFILTCLTSLSFFFVKFSIDGNMAILDSLASLNENQQKYKEALLSNTRLAYVFLLTMTMLTAFVFIMFFYRFFRSSKKQMGCLKSLAFTDRVLCTFFVFFTACIAMVGAGAGMFCGYFLSDILIRANEKTCTVSGLIRAVTPMTTAIGLLGGTIIFCLTAFLSYFFVRGKEPGSLIAGKTAKQKISGGLSAAERIVKIFPVRDKFPLRIALRKPLAVILIFAAVMACNVCFILGRSLNISSRMILDSQTKGHHYEYNTGYTEYKEERLPADALPYLFCHSVIETGEREIEQSVYGVYSLGNIFELMDKTGKTLPVPKSGEIYINPALAELYDVHMGDKLTLTIDSIITSYTVRGIAENAQRNTVYVNASALSKDIKAPIGSYNGVWSMSPVSEDGTTVSKTQIKQELERDATSNKTSAVINQVIGAVIGCILLFLALYLNFQDNQRDISILDLLGYSQKEIRKMLIHIYRPMMWTAFILTLFPSILTAKAIQKTLSYAIHDYMPFGMDRMVLLLLFIFLNVLYQLVECVFSIGILKVCKRGNLNEISAL